MKKPYMCTITGSSERECTLIILFQLYGSKPGFFNVIYFGRKTNPILMQLKTILKQPI